ncbi:proline hydroxylase [Actinokineospora auranticolor]|uniref:2-oxoglutarate-Fe(II)-dependent oxygenase superfamily protein n=1 Tax=Actinokineospora auranticolor TaxID=155976 RepID=A0A2S6GKH7_9PSEU|nr:proline hydroxylase [Actinokineospora auranticolor]PPK65646.1 hypothetical protein CLV40_113130 [Actinokineospora auranticolor]
MISAATHDPFFTTVTSSAFHRDAIADLAAGRTAAIRVPDLLPAHECAEIMRALSERAFDTYDTDRIQPAVMRCGVGVSDHRADGRIAPSYWTALLASRRMWQDLDLPFDPFERCRTALGAHWPHPVLVGRSGGREMGPGVAREPNGGFQIHFDDAIREFTGNLLDANLIAQFAFNLYLSVPDRGGETVIWRHRWHPDDERLRLPHASYGYAESVVGDAEALLIRPVVGEALLLDPRNFHAVRPGQGARRVALGFSVGMADSGELLVWG